MSNTFLPRGIDYLGDLGGKLRVLQGFRTLLHELIQNADDAPNATQMWFDVCDDALIVDNNDAFKDCQHVEREECPWTFDDTRGHRCDFHRFRRIGSGDKRGEAGTTGAFGIGFIAVYQITDLPELISAGRHWVIDESREENSRIAVCSGCTKCRAPNPGTRFILPWARDPNSVLRRALRAEPVSQEGPQRLVEELERSLCLAMLFLKRLCVLEIKKNGQRVRRFERLIEENSLILSDGEPKNDRVWHIIRGDFLSAAEKLRATHNDRIEAKRSASVALAISSAEQQTGVLCACLPTEQDIGLPFHVNADFFPTNDRKRVILDQDYQSEWNREALRAAARTLGSAINRLPGLLGAQRFWSLVESLKQIADTVGQDHGEPTLSEFWERIAPRLRTAPAIETARGEWTTADKAYLLSQKDEIGAIELLEALEVRVIHENLRPYHNVLLSKSVGVRLFDIEALCTALKSAGLTRRTELSVLPSGLKTNAECETLWKEIATLLDRQRHTPRARAEDERLLQDVAIAPGRDGALWPPKDIYHADVETVVLFEQLRFGTPFVKTTSAFAPLLHLCFPFNAHAAVQLLSENKAVELDVLWRQDVLPLRQLFDWFENHRQEILSDEKLRNQLAASPLFPSADKKLKRLHDLSLAGDFTDPLGLAELVDVEALGDRREFLSDLGATKLDFETYVTKRLPDALTRAEIPIKKKREAVFLLASRLGDLKDIPRAHKALVDAPLIECTDGKFRQADECYLDCEIVRLCLGDGINRVVLPLDHTQAVRDLYIWLGVENQPRLAHIVTRVLDLCSKPYSSAACREIQNILIYLAERFSNEDEYTELAALRTAKWLPARGKVNWFSPNEVYAPHRAHIFLASQATVLDAPAEIQQSRSELLKFLGVQINPPPNLVVKHLLYCASQGVQVHTQVYQFLNNEVEKRDPVLNSLKGQKCLYIGREYLSPREVFWGEHPFGRFRRRLGEELHKYAGLLRELEVREAPAWDDAFNVLREIGAEFGTRNRPLDEEAHAVVMACWRLLGRALDEGAVTSEAMAELRSVKCVPSPSHVLYPPEWMFFENRAGLATKFSGFLADHVIARPAGTGRALDHAGVRGLGTAVRIELLECTDPVDDLSMNELLQLRTNAIGRVIEAQGNGQEVHSALKLLAAIRCQEASSIQIKYRLQAFDQVLQSPPEEVPALYQPEQEILAFTRKSKTYPWAAIARELATAFFPEEDPGRFAAGLKEALSAESVNEAAAVLDELGFARLDTEIQEAPMRPEALPTLGIDVPTTPDITNEPGPIGHGQPQSVSLTPAEALARLGLGGFNPVPAESESEEENPNPEIGGRRGSVKSSGSSKNKGRPVLRSYVPAPKDSEPGAACEPEDKIETRSPVDAAGIRCVMEYERDCGRTPTEMPHTNPGYDVESRNTEGKVLRYIEVKSFSGLWGDTYAVLSRRQFEKALDLGDLFWLYVVERAESNNFKIYRVQSPAGKANHFMFDDGWRATDEFALSSKEGK